MSGSRICYPIFSNLPPLLRLSPAQPLCALSCVNIPFQSHQFGSQPVKIYEGRDIRNVGVVGHGHAGKTSLTAGLLYASGATNRLTRADEGNTITDFDEEEIQRKITISSSLAYAEWKKNKVNLIDTPGFNIFVQDAKASMIAADGAVIVV